MEKKVLTTLASTYITTTFHIPMLLTPLIISMRFWELIKKSLQKAWCPKTIRGKAVWGPKLVEAGGLLTGGSILMERLTSPASPQVSGEEVTYNSDKSPSFFKFEFLQLASKGSDKKSTTEVLGWLLLGAFLVLLPISIIK